MFNKLVLALFLFVPFALQAASSVWLVEKGERKVFIGGTIHLLSASDYPLPTSYDSAFKQSNQLIFEIDLKKAESVEFQNAFLKALSYPSGKTLADDLKPDTLLALQKHLQSRGMTLAPFETFSPALLSISLTVMELKRAGMGDQGVDSYYFHKAQQQGLSTGALETLAQQITFLAAMDDEDPDGFVRYTLEDLSSIHPIMTEMKAAWRNGDLAKLQQVALTPWVDAFPDIYQTLLVNRNRAWMPKIEAMFSDEPVEFILVGALHLAGKDGVLAMLKDKGCRVSQMP